MNILKCSYPNIRGEKKTNYYHFATLCIIIYGKIHPHQTMQSYVKIHGYYSNRVNLHLHYSFGIYFVTFFMYLKGKEKKWMIVVMCKETETIKKKN